MSIAVVITKSRIFGPFKDANEAARWLLLVRPNISVHDGLPSIAILSSPDFVEGWKPEPK